MKETSCDVAVIGGGPAGTSTAITLARSGARVVLFEANTYPHDKLCGEFLSPECVPLLRKLGVDRQISILGPARIERVRISAASGESWQAELPGTAWGLSRKAFDAELARHAGGLGVEIRDGTRVTGITGSLNEGFQVDARSRDDRMEFEARVVVAAHGKRSNLDRKLDRSFIHDRYPFLAIQSHFRGPSLSNQVELHAFPGGYCGLSEIEDHQLVACMLVRQTAFRQAALTRENRDGDDDPIERFIEWLMTQNSHLDRWFSRAEQTKAQWNSIAQIPFVEKRLVVNDVLMVGDAAGLIAPLAGDGIAMAIEGGNLVGMHVSDFLGGSLSTEGLFQAYQRNWEERFAARLRLSYRLQGMMLRPKLNALTLRILRLFPALGRYLVFKTRGIKPTVH